MILKISSSLEIQSSITEFDSVEELNVLVLWKIWTSKTNLHTLGDLIGMKYP